MKSYDRNLEMRVIGVLIIHGSSDKNVAINILSSVTEDYFFTQETKGLFNLIKDQAANDLPFDIFSLSPIAPEGCYELLAPIMANEFYASLGTINGDIETLRKMTEARPLLKLIADFQGKIMAETNLDKGRSLIGELGAMLSETPPTSMDYERTYEQLIDEILSTDEVPDYFQTNLANWPPFPAAGMITVGGRSGVGKTYTGLRMMDGILDVKPNTRAIYFNLEMRPRIMIKRHLGMVYEGQSSSLKKNIEDGGGSVLMDRDVVLVTKPGILISEIEMICKRHAMEKDISVIVLDYVGQIRTEEKGDDWLQQERIAQTLAGLAIKLKCVVIALQQINRDAQKEKRADKTPLPHDAAGSVGFERASEWWLGIDKPQMHDKENASLQDLFVIKNRKQRGEGGYFTIYQEFRDGVFYDINQQEARNKLQLPKPAKQSPLHEFKKPLINASKQ